MNGLSRALICAVDREPDRAMAHRLAALLRTYKPPKDVGGHSVIIEEDYQEAPLSDMVKARLDQYDHLILICSPGSKQSRALCDRLDYMDAGGRRGQVIAVLADGEPVDAFPPFFIQIRRAQRMLPDGSIEEYAETVEPVASDLRATNEREAKRRLQYETVRITAALIGVAPDTLERRHERRRRARLRRVLGVALAVAIPVASVFSYLGWRAAQEAHVATLQTQAGAEMVNDLFGELPERFQQAAEAAPYVQDVVLNGIDGLMKSGSANLTRIDLPSALSPAEGDGAEVALRKAALWRRAGDKDGAKGAYRAALQNLPLDAEPLIAACDWLVETNQWPGYAACVIQPGDAPVKAGALILELDGKAFLGYHEFRTLVDGALPGASMRATVAENGVQTELTLTRENLQSILAVLV